MVIVANNQLFVSFMLIFSVVTTIEFPPPSRWLATTDLTPSPWCFTVFLVVFLGTVSRKAVRHFSDRNEALLSAVMWHCTT